MPTPNYKFIAELDDFLDHHGLSDTRAGLLAVRDGHVVSRIRAGRARRSTILRVRRWMARFQLEHDA
jgi:lysine/ornithine N-monooxygenase